MRIFAESRPDYFPTQISPESWRKEVQQLSSVADGAVLCLNEEGFTAAGKLYALWQKFKGLLGFNDETQEAKIGGRIIKLLFIGSAEGYVEESLDQIASIKEKIDQGHLQVHEAVKRAFENLKTAALRAQLENFYTENEDSLTPSFWNQSSAQTIDLPPQPQFGDTHLALARAHENTDPLQALSHYQLAAQLYTCSDAEFTDRLTEAFSNFSQTLAPNPEIGAVHLLLARRQFSLNRFEQAAQLFQQTADCQVDLAPNQKALWMSAAANSGQLEVAEKLLSQLPADFQAPETCLRLAEEAFRAERFIEASKLFAQAAQNGAVLDSRQKALWMVAAANQGLLDIVERLSIDLIDFVPEEDSLKKKMGSAYLLLARAKAEAQELRASAEYFHRAFSALGNLDEDHRLSWLIAVAKIDRLDVADWLSNSFSRAATQKAAAGVYLELAKNQSQINQPHQAVRFFEIAWKLDRNLGLEPKALWLIAAAKIGRLDRVELLSGELRELSGPLRHEVGETYLTLSNRYNQDQNYERAEHYFRLAFQNGIALTQEQNFSWFIAAAITGKLDVVEKFAGQFSHAPQSQVAAAYLKLAETNFGNRQFERADRFYKLAAQQTELSMFHQTLWFLSAEKLGNYETEESLFPRISGCLPDSSLKEELQRAYLRLAEKNYQLSRFDRAVKRFEAASRTGAQLAPADKALWMISLTKLRDFAHAALVSQHLLDFFPEEPLKTSLAAAYLTMAENDALQNRWIEAEKRFTAALQNGAELSADQKALRLIVLTHLENFEEAKKLSNEIAQNAPFNGTLGEAHLQIAEAEFEACRYEEAILFFSRASELNPRQKALCMIAAAKIGRLDLAETLAETAIADPGLKEELGETYLHLAEQAYSNKQLEQAARFFHLASSNEIPLSAQQKACWMIAAAMTRQHHVAEQLSLEVPPLQANDPARKLVAASYLVLAEAKLHSGNREGVERLFHLASQNGADLTPRHVSLWLIAAAHEGQTRKAEQIARSLSELIPDADLKEQVGKVYLILAEEKYEQGKFAEADAYFQLGSRNEGKFTERQKILWLILSFKIGHFDRVEQLAENIPELPSNDPRLEVGEACLALAQKKWESRQIAESEKFFNLAALNSAKMSQHQKALWMIACVEKERFEVAEKLFHEIEFFNPSENLRALLAGAMIRLATYLASKPEVEKSTGGVFSLLWSKAPGQMSEMEKKALTCYQRAAELAPAEDRKTTNLLVHYFIPFAARFSNPDLQIGKIYLILAERMHLFHEFADAEKYFQQAIQNKVSLNSEQTAVWMVAAAKAKNLATVVKLAQRVADSPLYGPLKTEVQEIYLVTASHFYEVKQFEQADFFYQLAFKTQSPLTLNQKAFWIISALRIGRPEIAEQFSKEDFEPLAPALRKEIGKAFLLQADKQSELENYPGANRFFQLAFESRAPLNKNQQIRWFCAAVETKDFKTAEKLGEEIGECEPNDPLKKVYLDAMLRLADQYAAPKGYSFLPSWGSGDSTALTRKASIFYYRAFLTLEETDPLRLQLLSKIAQTAHCLKTDEPLMKLPFDSPNPLERICSHLIMIKHPDSLASPIHRKSIDAFTDEIWKLYKSGENEQCLPLIEEALSGIGDIKNKYLYIKKSFFTRSSLDIGSNIPDLLDATGAFVFNVGAKLHFLKGEILRKKEGDTERVLAAYELADQLAPRNPFGAGALFLVDDQKGGERSAHIDAYRKLALAHFK